MTLATPVGRHNVLGTFDPSTQGSNFFDVSGSSLAAIDPYSTHIQVALCYLIQQRTGDPIVLLGPGGTHRSRSRDVNTVIRMRRFTCGALLRLSPRCYIETLFNGSVLLPSSDVDGNRKCWSAQMMNHTYDEPLSLTRNEIDAWQLDWEGYEPVNTWLNRVFSSAHADV